MGVNRFDWNQFSEIRNAEELTDYLNGRQYQHTEYYHYTKAKSVNSILGSHRFLLPNVAGFNDRRDIKQFNDPSVYFSMCFSTGTSENLPMWYLYSGMKGDGARIKMTKGVVKKLIENSTYTLLEKSSKDPAKVGMRLNADDMERKFLDIIYSNDHNVENVCRLKYNTMTNNEMPVNEFKKYYQDHVGFCKGLIWYYEKETRLLIRLKGKAEQCIRRGQKEGKEYVIALDYDENLEYRFSVTFAPNVTTGTLQAELSQYEFLEKFHKEKSKVLTSSYQGTILMDFCSKCDRKPK